MRNGPPDHRDQRSFGLSVGGVCALLAGVFLWKGSAVSAALWAILAVALLVPAMTKPNLLRLPSAWWWRFARALGWVNARVLLSAFFFLVLTPVGLAMRLGGWDPLQRRRIARSSGWLPYPERIRNPKHYDRMY